MIITDPRVVLLGDLHFADKPPRNATDGYVDDLFGLLDWAISWTIEQKISDMIWAGDIFHHKNPSRTSHALVLRLLDRVKHLTENDVRLWIVTGNHDISNDDLSSTNTKQPLGVLFKAGARELDGWMPDRPIFGVPWQSRWDHEGVLQEAFGAARKTPPPRLVSTGAISFDGDIRRKYEAKYGEWPTSQMSSEPTHEELQFQQRFLELQSPSEPLYPDSDDVNAADVDWHRTLVVTHASLYPPGEEPPFDVLDIHAVAATLETGYVYYGHIHEYHSVYEVDGVKFANLGALSRGSVHEYNLTRGIFLATWDPDAGFAEIEIPAKPASEVFRMTEVVEAKEKRLSLENFLSGLGHAQIDVTGTQGFIEHVRGREDVPTRVRTTAVEILEEVDGQ